MGGNSFISIFFQAKKGDLLNTAELVKVAKKRGYNVPWSSVAQLRETWEPTAVRRYAYKRPQHFQTMSIPRLGFIQARFYTSVL